MSTPTTNPILARIAKLHAAARSGRTEEEAQSFAAKVQELLQDNGLTMAQVEQAGGSTADVGGTREKRASNNRAMYEYQRRLMAALAENNFCYHTIETVVNAKPLYSGGRGKTSRVHVLIGRQINVTATENMYDYLEETMRRLGVEAGIPARETKETTYFLEGCTNRVVERLYEKRRQREAEERAARDAQPKGNGTHRELVLSDVYGSEKDLNNDVLNGWPAGTTVANRMKAQRRNEEREARAAELVAQGIDKDVAFYMSYGYGPDEAKTYAENWRKRNNRSGGRGRSQGWTNANRKEYEKVNSASYQAGRAAGNNVGLDTQVGGSKRKLLK